jgi:uridylate kinase
MPILVMKFGGTSVATLDRIARVAKRVAREVANGYDVIVIVSAMAGRTNELVGWVEETSPMFDAREYDAVVSSGENVTAGLMALRLQEMDIPARSWQGWQVPVRTTSAHSAARIEEIPTANIAAKFAAGMKVAVVAGFQGVSAEGRITTLGRGGSDTTAVAFAAAFGAERCDIYTDVDGIYTTDPRISHKARKLDKIAYEEMLELASLGAKVLQTRSVELAMRYKVKLRVLSSFEEYDPNAGTLVCDEEEIVEQNALAGVAYSPDLGGRPPRHRLRHLHPPGRGRGERRHDRAEHLGRGPHRHDVFLPHQPGGAGGKDLAGRKGPGRDQLPRPRGRRRRRQGLDRRYRDAQPGRDRGQDVLGAGPRRHQIQGHHLVGYQDLGADRPQIHGTRGPGAARRLRAGEILRPASANFRTDSNGWPMSLISRGRGGGSRF